MGFWWLFVDGVAFRCLGHLSSEDIVVKLELATIFYLEKVFILPSGCNVCTAYGDYCCQWFLYGNGGLFRECVRCFRGVNRVVFVVFIVVVLVGV